MKKQPKQSKSQRQQTAEEICEVFDISSKTLSRWIDRGCPHDGYTRPKKFNENEVASWMGANGLTGRLGRPDQDTGPIGEQLKAARLRKEMALAEKHEIALAKEKGELVNARDVEKSNIEKFICIRHALMQLPGLSFHLEGKTAPEMDSLIESKVEEILTILSKS